MRIVLWLTLAGLFFSPSSLVVAMQSDLIRFLKKDLRAHQQVSFETLMQSWEKKYGHEAFQPLLQIAQDPKIPDHQRYIALMTAVKVRNPVTRSALVFTPFLKDPAWMIRSGALTILAAFQDPLTADLVTPLIHDPALVVRIVAVEAILSLRPKTAVPALISAVEDPQNYHGGKAQSVPQKALLALVELNAQEMTPRLVKLLENPLYASDVSLHVKTIQALEKLNGKSVVSHLK